MTRLLGQVSLAILFRRTGGCCTYVRHDIMLTLDASGFSVVRRFALNAGPSLPAETDELEA